jgi:hypothetical protein
MICSLRALTACFIKRFQHLLWTRADGGAFGQVRPKDRAGRVDQELGRAGDVGVLRSSSGMKKIITADHLSLRVGKKEKLKAKFLNLAAVDFRRVHADGGHTNAARVEFRDSLLKTPQLGVTERSPIPPIKNQQRAFVGNQIDQRDRSAALIGQGEVRRFLADTRRGRRRRQLPNEIKSAVGKKNKREQSDGREDRTENFAAIKVWFSKRAHETEAEQNSAHTKKQQVRPRKISRDRILDKEFVTKEPDEDENESNP